MRREEDLRPLRDELAELIRSTPPLHVAHTFTVSPENVDGVADVVRWVIENIDVFRILSFQPAAPVGRTQAASTAGPDTRHALWKAISRGLESCAPIVDSVGAINRHAFVFGHPDCSEVALLGVARLGRRRFPCPRPHAEPSDR